MTTADQLARLQTEARQELTGNILPYWLKHAPDTERGGFIGRIDGLHQRLPDAPKSLILNTRILWTFSAAARMTPDPAYRAMADRAYAYLTDYFFDGKFGGVYWMLDARGCPLDTHKRTYAQAFALYALSEYYRLTEKPDVLRRARYQFEAMQAFTRDQVHGGYLEVFSPYWTHLPEATLSEKEPAGAKTMNTHLHVLEAYTTLLRIHPDPSLHAALKTIVTLFLDRLIDPGTHHLCYAVDKAWKPVSDTLSFGHDLETSWLLVEATEVLKDKALTKTIHTTALQMAQAALDRGVDTDGGLMNEGTLAQGITDTDKIWWCQAEAMIGSLNAFQLSGEVSYLDATLRLWNYIQQHLIDRKHGGWLYSVTRTGKPIRREDKLGPWKAPYHNARACLELIRRTNR